MTARSALVALGATVLAAASALTVVPSAHAAPSAVGALGSASDCTFILESVTSDRLQERFGDEIRLVVGGENYPSRIPRYVNFDSPDVTAPASAFGSPQVGFTNQVAVNLREVDLGTDDLGTVFVPCTATTDEDVVFDRLGARYTVTYSVVEL